MNCHTSGSAFLTVEPSKKKPLMMRTRLVRLKACPHCLKSEWSFMRTVSLPHQNPSINDRIVIAHCIASKGESADLHTPRSIRNCLTPSRQGGRLNPC